ncbi:MAG: hypothetical protein ACRYFA_03745 [Janthinobacterium lividum]
MKNAFWIGLLLLSLQSCAQNDQEIIVGPANALKVKAVLNIKNSVVLKDMFGINAFEWDFLAGPDNGNDPSKVSDLKMEPIKSFSSFRHYMDWEKLEATPGVYTFNPTTKGGWNYDAIYERCKKENITVLACLKTCPDWLVNTYPQNERDAENVPAPYGSDLENPASYILQAKAAFQFTARYGSNTKIDTSLVKVNQKPRWPNDQNNLKKTGLDLVKYIECDNERDKTWKGKKAYQTPQQYAANLSAFYDGHKGKLGKNVGVKTADPNMQVVMGGLASPDVNYVQEMINWCKRNRGYKADGSVDLCFDVINYHFYANNDAGRLAIKQKRGIAPELSEAGTKADEFVKLAHQYNKNMQVWVTETGYDINSASPQSAMVIGDKTVEATQADWILRTSLLYARHQISKVFFYMLDDVNKQSPVQYSSSGLAQGLVPRQSAYYLLQTKNLMGDYQYVQTLSTNPLIDIYASGQKKIYVLTVPDETGKTIICHLNLGDIKLAAVYSLQADTSFMSKKMVPVVNGMITITASEKPIFVETN